MTSTAPTTATTEVDQKKYETEFEAYKDAVRYAHAVLTLQRPVHYGVWAGVMLIALLVLGTRDWSNGTTFFVSVIVYFVAKLSLDLAGPLPFAKFVGAKYDDSEADPFVRACRFAAYVEGKACRYWQDMREFRRLNNVKFTFQVGIVSFIGAVICSYVSDFTFVALALVAVFAVPPIVTKELHLQALMLAKPHVELLKSKATALIAKATGAASSAGATAAPAAAAETKKSK